MKDSYIQFWAHNGNVAAIWHIVAALYLALCVGMVWYGNRCDRRRDRNSRPADEVFENFERYPENTDRHDY